MCNAPHGVGFPDSEIVAGKKINHKLIAEYRKHGIILLERNERRQPKMLCKTVNAMSFAEYSYESEFESYEFSFVSHTHRQAKTDLERLRCVF